jgi:Zn ribbon nucleic-acid-binding protein
MTTYREIIRQLTADEPGLCVDATCPQCGNCEMSLRVKWPEGVPLDPPILLCRKCGHAQRNRPKS